MVDVGPQSKPLMESSLQSFFHDSLSRAMNNQQVRADEATVWYLTNLLTTYSRSERLFDETRDGRALLPLAQLYALAAEAASEAERRLVLQRLGDVALFISGLFSGLFVRRRRLVDVDYYIAMGGNAYGYLSEKNSQSARGTPLATIFRQLSMEFVRFVDVLAEVGEKAPGCDERDVLRMHELWSRTGSPRLERKLRDLGVGLIKLAETH